MRNTTHDLHTRNPVRPNKPQHHTHLCAVCLVIACLAAPLSGLVAYAGGGPANVAVVVNADSWASMTIANEFIHLRRVPPANVIYLEGLPDFEQTPVEVFRERILKPVLQTIQDRGLAEQIDCLVYSSDLPFRINVSKDKQGDKFSKIITPWASINGLTYLHRLVLAKDTTYLDLGVNRYARRPSLLLDAQTIGRDQRETYVAALKLMEKENWAEAAPLVRKVLDKTPRAPEALYNLACCLARQDQGDEAMAFLERAVDAGFLNFAHLATDKDLKSLRNRKEFKALVERMKTRVFDVQPTRGFRGAYAWDGRGEIVASEGRSYLLSTMLAVTSGRGNSVGEALESLRRSAAADGTKPTGTVYYMVNKNIRSLVRQWGFGPAAGKLQELGVGAEVLDGKLPQDKADVQGAMLGSATFDWGKSSSTILPGAICEHLTSCGAILVEGATQTPLTDLIRNGAAGASGTVTEPYAVQAKFPDPFIHVHYARGCTLAEAFYQSVGGPYQLLIVGDPLCRPWAEIPVVTAEGVKPGDTIKGRVSLRPGVQAGPATAIKHYELFVDGRRHDACLPGEALDLHTRELDDGYHELRIVAIAKDLIETQGELILPVNVSDHGRQVEVTPLAEGSVVWGRTLRLSARLRGASAISFLHNERVLATIHGAEGEVEIDSRKLGLGPVALQAVGVIGDPDSGVRVTSQPIMVRVLPPPALAALELPPNADWWSPGIELTPEGGEPVTIESTRPNDWLAKAGVKQGQSFSLTGHFDVPTEDVYQLQVRTDGEVVLAVDATQVGKAGGDKWKLLPVSLAAGTHKLTLRGTAGGRSRLDLRFGGPGALSVGADRFRHMSEGGE